MYRTPLTFERHEVVHLERLSIGMDLQMGLDFWLSMLSLPRCRRSRNHPKLEDREQGPPDHQTRNITCGVFMSRIALTDKTVKTLTPSAGEYNGLQTRHRLCICEAESHGNSTQAVGDSRAPPRSNGPWPAGVRPPWAGVSVQFGTRKLCQVYPRMRDHHELQR